MSHDLVLSIAKQAPLTLTKAEWYDQIRKRAERFRRAGESQQSAAVRFATSDPDGQLLMAAYQKAKGPSWQPKNTNKQESQSELSSGACAVFTSPTTKLRMSKLGSPTAICE